MKFLLGIMLAFALGFGCRMLHIPSPAPPALTGALLVVAITLGHAGADHVIATRARRAADRASD